MNYSKLFTLTILAGLLFIAGCATPQIPNEEFESNDTSTQPPENQNLPFFIFYPTEGEGDGITYDIDASVNEDGETVIDTRIEWDFTIEDIAPDSDYDGDNPGLYLNIKQGNYLLTESYDVSRQVDAWRSVNELELSDNATQHIRERCRDTVLHGEEPGIVRLEGRVVVNPEQSDLPENTDVEVNHIEETQVPGSEIGFRDYTQNIEVECPEKEDDEDVNFGTSPENPVVEAGSNFTSVTFYTRSEGVRYQWRIDGETYTGSNVTVRLPAGSHEVTLQVTEATGNEIQTTKTVTVSEEEPGDIQADFERNPDRARTGREDPVVHQNVVYESMSEGEDLTYFWNVDGETLGQEPTLQHRFEEPGMKEVTLKVQDRFGQTSTYSMIEDVQQPQNYEPGIPNVSITKDRAGSETFLLIRAQESMALQSGQIMMFFDGMEYVRNSSYGAIPGYEGLVFENLEDDGQWNIAFAGSEDEPLRVEEGETLLGLRLETNQPGIYEIRMPVEDQYPNTNRGVYTQLTPVGVEDAPRGLPNTEVEIMPDSRDGGGDGNGGGDREFILR